jgi:hypothetical protein
MPDIDPNSPYAHLIYLALEYWEIIEWIQSGMLDTEEIQYLDAQRVVLHEQILEEMSRLKLPISDRTEAAQQAINIARRYKH